MVFIWKKKKGCGNIFPHPLILWIATVYLRVTKAADVRSPASTSCRLS